MQRYKTTFVILLAILVLGGCSGTDGPDGGSSDGGEDIESDGVGDTGDMGTGTGDAQADGSDVVTDTTDGGGDLVEDQADTTDLGDDPGETNDLGTDSTDAADDVTDASDAPDDGGELPLLDWPATVGTTWTYGITGLMGFDAECVLTLSGSVEHGGETYLTVSEACDDLASRFDISPFRIGPGGLFVYDSDTSSEFLLLRYPAEVGDSYALPWGTMEVASLDSSCRIGDDEYACIEYRAESETAYFIRESWRVLPGVGVVLYTGLNDFEEGWGEGLEAYTIAD